MADKYIVLVVAIITFAAVAVIAFYYFRQRARFTFKAPFIGAEVDARNPSPGVRVKKAESTEGGLKARDVTGRGTDAEDIKARKDIDLSSELPPEPRGPKV